MAQWERLQQQDMMFSQKVSELYNTERFPMEVRHYLSVWIESQEWERAYREDLPAAFLFQGLLENLDNQISHFAQEKQFVLQCNFRRYKQAFQRYQEKPYDLAYMFHWFLTKEKEILAEVELSQQVMRMKVQTSVTEQDNDRHIEKQLLVLKSTFEVIMYKIRCLEEQQDELDFKYKIIQMDSRIEEQRNALQSMFNDLDKSRKNFLSEIQNFLNSADTLSSVLIDKELLDWKLRQQRSCIGAPDDMSLENLQKWFTEMVDFMFHILKFLLKLDELSEKLTYDNDPLKKKSLKGKVDKLLVKLLKNALVVETQPTMPLSRGPLVLRTNQPFSVKVRFLYKVPELKHVMKVEVSIDKGALQAKGFRKFNVLGTNTKTFNITESNSGGMVAEFRPLSLRDQKASGGGKGINDVSLSVTEELHRFNFESQFNYQGFSVTLETSSLPVVVISNSSQQQSAWASVLWFNMLCSDPTNVGFFKHLPTASWEQFADMISWQFLSCGKRGLDQDQLETLAIKLFGKQLSYENCSVSWAKFCKENLPGTNFTLWAWLDGILNLVKLYLSDLWKDGLIMGFVSKGKEKVLLKQKQCGTFLLRFSESVRDGGITFSWNQYENYETPVVSSVKPFTSADLKQIALPDILLNFQIMEPDNTSHNPLCYLYPDTLKNEAFGKYYKEKSGDENPYLKYLSTKLVFVSKKNGCTGSSEGPLPDMCPQHVEDSPFSELDDDDGLLLQVPENMPMLSGSTIDKDLFSAILERCEDDLSDVFSKPHISPTLCQETSDEGSQLCSDLLSTFGLSPKYEPEETFRSNFSPSFLNI